MPREAIDYHTAADQVANEFDLKDQQRILIGTFAIAQMTLTNQFNGGGHGNRDVTFRALELLINDMKKINIPDEALYRLVNLLYPLNT